MSLQDVEIIEQALVYKGYFQIERFKLRHRLFKGGWSEIITRELFERGQAVAALLYDPIRDEVVLIQQFRIGLMRSGKEPWVTEIVAGILEANDESAEAVVRREAEEEAGIEVMDIKPLYNYWVSPGSSTEQVHLFCARVDASKAEGIHGLDHEGEDIKVVVYPVAEALQRLHNYEFNNAFTIIALQWLQLHHATLRAEWSKV